MQKMDEKLSYNNSLNNFCPGHVPRRFRVLVECDPDAKTAEIISADEPEMCDYVVKMESVHGCPLKKEPSNNTDQSSQAKPLSGGTIFIIVFFSLCTLYLLGGAGFNFVIKGKRGKQVLPHLQFWSKVGGLVSDGFYFVRFKFTDNTLLYLRERPVYMIELVMWV
eukprot:TRINITY_DN4435_c0_g3_i1.p1 TRINITY_DN4435_c0_g3~~TRINITY_DN4435_c0_g3_i1.p1  ORF type:complete len:165 (+),score=28.74 TRINITY_DN4435_c0_g3_i1:221-715(+)